MHAPPHFEQAEDHAVLRLRGSMVLAEVVDLITDAIVFARATGMHRLLVAMTEVTGVKTPGLAARYAFIREWARVSGGLVRMAVAVPLQMLDNRKFGVTVAANAGMAANVFADEHEALEWLMGDE
ncbi:hypothetical protein [Prosthecobacter sp.]|uniref:hypothetical protein n=1 Tax=Prosthecobacter sp. TaxID=1965333 RepID=UPI003783C820